MGFANRFLWIWSVDRRSVIVLLSFLLMALARLRRRQCDCAGHFRCSQLRLLAHKPSHHVVKHVIDRSRLKSVLEIVACSSILSISYFGGEIVAMIFNRRFMLQEK